MKIERRRFLRIPAVSWVIINHQKYDEKPGLMVDISIGGLKLLTEKPIAAETEVLLRIQLESSKPVEIAGKIVWSRKLEADIFKKFNFSMVYLHGIAFHKHSAEIEVYLQEYFEFIKNDGTSLVQYYLNKYWRK
ncbi:MAG: PilZ domain-containing protein [Firmicutes bacterium]|nr:PilZ domain-containing protein [Bacillota bacterium]